MSPDSNDPKVGELGDLNCNGDEEFLGKDSHVLVLILDCSSHTISILSTLTGPDIESIDYNCCCYCAEEFATAGFRDKHELQCHLGPQLVVRLSTAEFQDTSSVSVQDEDRSGDTASQSRKG
nr:unnamed protein product [Callosobruchus analis]